MFTEWVQDILLIVHFLDAQSGNFSEAPEQFWPDTLPNATNDSHG